MTDIQKMLFSFQDKEYACFNAKLIPNIDSKSIIGVRTPILRKIASKMFNNKSYSDFINCVPHTFYEENNLHAFIIEKIKDYDVLICELERFLPFIDNWATCDSMKPKAIKKYPEKTKEKAIEWINSDATYTVRFGIGVLMNYYLENYFSSDILKIVAEIDSDEYYVKMMISWFFATALAKQYDETLPYITEHKLSKWCNNKTIRKAVESYRIADEQKEFLRSFVIK